MWLATFRRGAPGGQANVRKFTVATTFSLSIASLRDYGCDSTTVLSALPTGHWAFRHLGTWPFFCTEKAQWPVGQYSQHRCCIFCSSLRRLNSAIVIDRRKAVATGNFYGRSWALGFLQIFFNIFQNFFSILQMFWNNFFCDIFFAPIHNSLRL